MVNTRVTGYQALLNKPRVISQPQVVLNPATLLPEELVEHPHNCAEVLNQVTEIRLDLRDMPFPDAEMTLFIEKVCEVCEGCGSLS